MILGKIAIMVFQWLVFQLLFLTKCNCFNIVSNSRKTNNNLLIKIFVPFSSFSSLFSSLSSSVSSNGENDFEVNLQSKLAGMKAEDLKAIVKRFGGKPSAMRKKELIECCFTLLCSRKEEMNSKFLLHDNSATPQIIPRLRNMSPVNSAFKLTSNDLTGDNKLKDSKREPNRYPTGSLRQTRLEDINSGDMDITFLGTASCVPSLTRGVSCIAYRCNSEVWLFDCGESSQIQLQKSRVKASKITKVFLTHAHGDHSFGLPGVLCLMGQATQNERERAGQEGEIVAPIDIYGPEGTRDLVRAVIQLTYSRVVAPYRIHELKSVPFLQPSKNPPIVPIVRTRFDPNFGELEGSRDIYPDCHGNYLVFEEGDFTVQAAPMQHTVPCVGYVVQEKTKPGRLKVEKISSVVERNKAQLKEKLGLQDGNKVYAILKSLKSDDTFKFPDGTELKGADVNEPPREGRKVVILGDTSSAERIAPISKNADLLVHEATNAYLPDFDQQNLSSMRATERQTSNHGHSTPEMAGRFAKSISAKRLLLTHFSLRDTWEMTRRIL